MDLIIVVVLLFGIIGGLWYVVHATRDLYRTRERDKPYRCKCGRHEFLDVDEHYDDAHVYHGVHLCQPHREMIYGQKHPPR